jgi:hypothetical protein
MALADYQHLLDNLVRDQSGEITPTVRDRALDLAVARYSADVGRSLVADVVWLSTGHTGPLPAGWATSSYLIDAEFPIGLQPPVMVEAAIQITPIATQIMLVEPLLASETLRVRFGAPHLLQAGASPQDTIPLTHREAVTSYAAHLLCKQLATYYSGQRESAINADASNTDGRARNYAQRAHEYRAAYYAGVGKVDPQADAAVAAGLAGAPAANMGSWSGRPRLNLVNRSNL